MYMYIFSVSLHFEGNALRGGFTRGRNKKSANEADKTLRTARKWQGSAIRCLSNSFFFICGTLESKVRESSVEGRKRKGRRGHFGEISSIFFVFALLGNQVNCRALLHNEATFTLKEFDFICLYGLYCSLHYRSISIMLLYLYWRVWFLWKIAT